MSVFFIARLLNFVHDKLQGRVYNNRVEREKKKLTDPFLILDKEMALFLENEVVVATKYKTLFLTYKKRRNNEMVIF